MLWNTFVQIIKRYILMKFPNCSSLEVSVKDSRYLQTSNEIKRRRLCSACGYKFITFEKYAIKKMYVIKKSGKKEIFDQIKIFRSIQIVSKNREKLLNHIDKIVNHICVEFESSYTDPIETSVIADRIMTQIKKHDDVAYIRFVSVYCKFTSLNDFIKFLQKEYNII